MSAIESGLFELLVANSALSALIASKGVYFVVMAKGAALPAVVITEVVGLATVTLDDTGDLIQGRFQFDAYANDQMTARTVAKAVTRLLQDYRGTLPDGTQVRACELIGAQRDMPYEAGGLGYIFRSMSEVTIYFSES